MNLRMFKDLSRAKKYPEGTLLIDEGICNDLYIVLTGEAGIFINYKKANERLVDVSVPGDLVGEKQFFSGKSTHNTAVVLKDMIAVPVNKSTCLNFIRDEPEVSLEIMKILYRRLDELESEYKKNQKQAGYSETYEENNGECLSPLFPEGHGTYELPMNNEDREHLLEKSVECPICKKSFKALSVRASKLILEKTGEGMRDYYKSVEPLYYDVLTCPNCLYSALSEMFAAPEKSKTDIQQYLMSLKQPAKINDGTGRDTFSVFAGFYLALLCAPKCFINHQMTTAKLLLKLSRVYQDCGDLKLESETLNKALAAYLNVYEKVNITPAQEQQLCLVIGEIYLKLGDTDSAKNFFFKAKTNREGTPVYRDQADDRLFEIHEIEKAHA